MESLLDACLVRSMCLVHPGIVYDTSVNTTNTGNDSKKMNIEVASLHPVANSHRLETYLGAATSYTALGTTLHYSNC
jgi:hypothetical protein